MRRLLASIALCQSLSWRIGTRPVVKRIGLPDAVCVAPSSAHQWPGPSLCRNPKAGPAPSPAKAAIRPYLRRGVTKSSYRTRNLGVPS